MTSALIGSTTEPVNRNRTTKVARTTIASTTGRWSSRLDWVSMKWAVNPDAWTLGGALRQIPDRGHDVLARDRRAGRSARPRRPRPSRPTGAAGGLTAATPGIRSSLSLSRDSWARSAPATASSIGESRWGGNSVFSAVSTWRALADSGSTVASTEVNSMLRKGIPSAIISAALAAAIRPGRRITNRDSRYQNPDSAGRASRSARRWRKARRQRVHPRAQEDEDRGQDDQGQGRGDQRHQRPAEAHRVQEALREDHQRGQRGRHRQRGEQDRAPGGRHRAPHRLRAGGPLRAISSR